MFLPERGVTDNALVNYMQAGDQVFALTETSRACRVDPKTLETIEKVSTIVGQNK